MLPTLEYWGTLAVALTVYWSLPRKLRVGFLLAVSLVSLYYLDAFSAASLSGFAVAFYLLAPRPDTPPLRSRLSLIVLLTAIFGNLAYFKYLPRVLEAFSSNGSATEIVLPLGISYFTFKLVHFAVESRRGTLPRFNLLDFGCYIFLFPIFSAGPIERFEHFLNERSLSWNRDFAVQGLTRIIYGLIKQFALITILLPGTVGTLPTVTELLDNLGQTSPWEVWRFVILSYLYAYLNFSAYADLAIGSSRLFGITIMENFNFPILAQNISDFWTRWHMTLATWCQSYVYMPLIGITRNPYLAVYASFITIGLWHDGTLQWLTWGAYHATGVAIYTTWRRNKMKRGWSKREPHWAKWLGYPLTFLFVSAGYALTETHNRGGIYDSFRILAKLFSFDLDA